MADPARLRRTARAGLVARLQQLDAYAELAGAKSDEDLARQREISASNAHNDTVSFWQTALAQPSLDPLRLRQLGALLSEQDNALAQAQEKVRDSQASTRQAEETLSTSIVRTTALERSLARARRRHAHKRAERAEAERLPRIRRAPL